MDAGNAQGMSLSMTLTTQPKATVTAQGPKHLWALPKERASKSSPAWKSRTPCHLCLLVLSSLTYKESTQCSLWNFIVRNKIIYGKYLAPCGVRGKPDAGEVVFIIWTIITNLASFKSLWMIQVKNWGRWTSWSSTLAFIAKAGQMAALTDGICF